MMARSNSKGDVIFVCRWIDQNLALMMHPIGVFQFPLSERTIPEHPYQNPHLGRAEIYHWRLRQPIWAEQAIFTQPFSPAK